jgi:hypothetical protein
VTSSSLDNNPELKAKWEDDWTDLLSKPVDEGRQEPVPEAPAPPTEHITEKTIEPAAESENTYDGQNGILDSKKQAFRIYPCS